jgi:hypothetical protein
MAPDWKSRSFTSSRTCWKDEGEGGSEGDRREEGRGRRRATTATATRGGGEDGCGSEWRRVEEVEAEDVKAVGGGDA